MLRFHAGIVSDALRAIAAIFGASAGLDAQKGTDLHFVWIEKLAVGRMSLKQQVIERQPKQRLYFVQGPIGAYCSGLRIWPGWVS